MTAPPGPALVIAGAGSGKTRTLIYRVAFLLEQGIPPECILLLTFTNKAAKEMMRRVTDLLGGELSNLWGGTFHSIAARVLRRHATALGFQSDFSILDREDAKDMLQACLVEMNIDHQGHPFSQGRCPGGYFFALGQQGETGGRHSCGAIRLLLRARADKSAQLQQKYAARKKAANGMDFDDLLCAVAQTSAGQRRNSRGISSAGSNSSSWTNIRTPTKSRAT